MDVREILSQAGETITVKRVYGEPYERNGLTIIPAASIRGGGGGGEGENEQGKGSGGGFGVVASPAGAYVIKGEEVSWRPALDWTKIIVMTELLAIVGLLVRRSPTRRGERVHLRGHRRRRPGVTGRFR